MRGITGTRLSSHPLHTTITYSSSRSGTITTTIRHWWLECCGVNKPMPLPLITGSTTTTTAGGGGHVPYKKGENPEER